MRATRSDQLAMILDLSSQGGIKSKITSEDLVSEEPDIQIAPALLALRPTRLLGLGHRIAR
jgi:hypothetical protein